MNGLQEFSNLLQHNQLLLILYSIYVLTLKGIALWKSAQNSHKFWFIAILVINLFGIPELLYIFYFSKKHISLQINKKDIISSIKGVKKSSK